LFVVGCIFDTVVLRKKVALAAIERDGYPLG